MTAETPLADARRDLREEGDLLSVLASSLSHSAMPPSMLRGSSRRCGGAV